MSWARFSPSIHYSPWPCLIGVTAGSVASSLVILLNTSTTIPLVISFISLLFLTSCWINDISQESESGEYPLQTLDNLNLSFSLLIFSEAILFASLFWTFFHLALSPTPFIGHMWPPVGIQPISPAGLPLFNTILLISSGVTITWCHHLLIVGETSESTFALTLTLWLGTIFLLNQYCEFANASLTISDSVYGSIFLVLTGFHGLHVFLGLTILLISGIRLLNHTLTPFIHTSIELSIWYWHLVDCIWLLVITSIYLWGS